MKRAFILFLLLLLFVSSALAQGGAGFLSLKESIEIAKLNSESYAISKAKVDEADAVLGQAFSAMLPSLKLSGSLGRSYQDQPPSFIPANALAPGLPPTDITGNIFEAQETNTLAYSATLQQNLFTGGNVWNSYVAADIGVSAAEEELRASEIDLTYNVISAYYGVIKAKKGLDLANESLSLSNDHLSQAKSMFASGVATRADVLRGELDVARSELALSKAKSAVDLMSNSFNLTIGRDPVTPVALDENDFKIGDIKVPDYQEMLKAAYAFRPDWKMAQYGERIADKTTVASYSGYLPAFLLEGSYGYSNVQEKKVDIDSMLNNWSIALVGSWTIFDGLMTPNKVKEMTAKYVEASKQMDLLRKSVAIDVNNASLSLSSAVDEIKSAGKALELANENYNIAETRYAAGVGTNLEVIDAKTMLTTSKLDYLQAEFDYELAKAALDKAVGREVMVNSGAAAENPEITLMGSVQSMSLEGGFVGFIDEAGVKYQVMGTKASEIKNALGGSTAPRKIKLTGIVKSDVATTAMWGRPLEVSSYEWEQ